MYFCVNSGLIAMVVGLSSHRSMLQVWTRALLAAHPELCRRRARSSLLLVLAFREVHFTAIALIMPLLVDLLSHAAGVVRPARGRQAHVAQLDRLLLSTVETLAMAIDAKDEVTHSHVRRVQACTLGLARALGVTDAPTLKAIEAAALLHDTGKLAVPEHILNKPGQADAGRVRADEAARRRSAPTSCRSIEFPYPVVPIVRHHHENWDGSGYPDGLRGERDPDRRADPVGGRLLRRADVGSAVSPADDRRRPRSTILARAARHDVRPGGRRRLPALLPRIMPLTDTVRHPAAQAIGEARLIDRGGAAGADGGPARGPRRLGRPAGGDQPVARASAAARGVADVGALMWMVVRQVLPCEAMAVFLPDERADSVTVRYAAGIHAGLLRWDRPGRAVPASPDGCRSIAGPRSTRIRRWIWELAAAELTPGLRSCLAMPLIDADGVVAVLSLYRSQRDGFSEDDARLVELLAPRLASSLLGATRLEQREASGVPSLKLVKSS